MNKYQAITLADLEAKLAAWASERYGSAANAAEVQALAEKAGDCEYLLARIQCLELLQPPREDDAAWISPTAHNTAPQALHRIKTMCAQFTDLFNAMFAISATHQSVSREMLALAIKQFHKDAEALSKDDLVGLLTAIATGGQQAYEAVLRSRKRGDRKADVAAQWIKE